MDLPTSAKKRRFFPSLEWTASGPPQKTLTFRATNNSRGRKTANSGEKKTKRDREGGDLVEKFSRNFFFLFSFLPFLSLFSFSFSFFYPSFRSIHRFPGRRSTSTTDFPWRVYCSRALHRRGFNFILSRRRNRGGQPDRGWASKRKFP